MIINTLRLPAVLCVAIALAGPVSSLAQTDMKEVSQQIWKLSEAGKPLAGVQFLQNALDAEKTPETQRQIRDLLAQQMTLAGQYSRAISVAESQVNLKSDDAAAPPSEDLAALTPVPALDAIVAEARRHRVVVINEAHNEGATRAFNRRVVRALAAEGFRYLPMETLLDEEGLDRANHDHRVTRKVGWYSNDPVYASIMRSAWAAGYTLIKYEDRGNGGPDTPCDSRAKADRVAEAPPEGMTKAIQSREKHQACNLAQEIAKMPADAKMLIVVGHSHVRKSPAPDDGIRWMASYLEAYTGEDILAIDQTQQDGGKKQSAADPLVKQIYATYAPVLETVFRKPDGTYLVPKSLGTSVDMAVFRPDPRDKESWWRPDDELIEIELDAPGKGASWPIGLVRAQVPGTDSDIVPLDNFYAWKIGVAQIRLLLPKGTADIWFETSDGEAVKIGAIEVTGSPDETHPVIHNDDESRGLTIEQILERPPPERNQALAALRDSGALPPPEDEDPQTGGMNSEARPTCSPPEEEDKYIALHAAKKATSGAEFLLAEAEATNLLAEMRTRIDAAASRPAQSPDPMLVDLFRRKDKDQAFRTAWLDLERHDKSALPLAREIFSVRSWAIGCAIDHDNTAWMRDRLADMGWFDARRFGQNADDAAWLLVQHADDDPDFQASVLDILSRLVEEGGTSRRNQAYLYDRVAVHHGRLQRYGTQGGCMGKEWEPRPTEQPEQLDVRRTAIGLWTEEENRKRFKCDS